MAKNALDALIIPEGARFEANTQGWIVSNSGDVRLLGAPALPLYRVSSEEGDVDLVAHSPLSLDRIAAPSGTVTIRGPITVHSIYAQKVHFVEGQLSVRSLVAESTIQLDGEHLQADMVVAPQVGLNKDTKGRATVIQSKNELGATQLKGGFRMDDYLELFPNGQEQINQYADVKSRMERWDGGQAPDDEPLVLTQPIATQDDVDQQVESLLDNDGEGAIEVLAEEPDDDELFDELSDRIAKVLACYTDSEVPPQVSQIDKMIQTRQFSGLRKQINGLYSELIRYHRKERLNIHNAVASNIKDIRQLLSA